MHACIGGERGGGGSGGGGSGSGGGGGGDAGLQVMLDKGGDFHGVDA